MNKCAAEMRKIAINDQINQINVNKITLIIKIYNSTIYTLTLLQIRIVL